MELSSNCTIFLAGRKGEAPSAAEIQKKLESPKENVKIQGMQELITGFRVISRNVHVVMVAPRVLQWCGSWAVLQGERYDKLLVTAIRFCVPCSNSHVKKLTFLFLELVDKCDAQGRLKEEIILVCVRVSAFFAPSRTGVERVNALRNDLTSPNEYVRGSALRLAAKIRQAKIIEPLVEAIVKNLQQQQQQQGDTAALLGMGDQMQLALLELLRKAFRLKLPARSALLRLTIALLPSAPPSVAYEGACCVLSLGSSPAGLRAACGALCQLLLQQTEHNIKLIVLDRLSECVDKAKPGSLSDFVVDLMRGESPTL
ncbi:hypothetical protein ACSSS7_003908 [Eimeria intestinalis]